MQKYYDELIMRALAEDIGSGDHSSNCSIPVSAHGRMRLLVKEAGVLAGVEVARRVFELVDTSIRFSALKEDGTQVQAGDLAFELQGPVRSLLRGERLALNFMQRMSGIASYTQTLVKMISHTNCKLLDTRKTTPSLRFMEKEAVRMGGGYNHRFGLYDMIMLKDNHVDFAGGVAQAIAKAKEYLSENKLTIPIEVETRNFQEIEQVMTAGGVKRIMFDNFSVEDTVEAVKLVGHKCETESSGGINESTLVGYAETGVNFISIGALTHSVKSLDLSLKAF